MTDRYCQSTCLLAFSLSVRLQFLVDRTNGRAYVTALRPSVCLSSVTLLWLNGVSRKPLDIEAWF